MEKASEHQWKWPSMEDNILYAANDVVDVVKPPEVVRQQSFSNIFNNKLCIMHGTFDCVVHGT